MKNKNKKQEKPGGNFEVQSGQSGAQMLDCRQDGALSKCRSRDTGESRTGTRSTESD